MESIASTSMVRKESWAQRGKGGEPEFFPVNTWIPYRQTVKGEITYMSIGLHVFLYNKGIIVPILLKYLP